MSVSDFRQITLRGEASKGERLFRAAVSAFCSLPRPSRRDIAQLEDLTLPLFDCMSPDSMRYVSAALSECPYPPPALVRRLCEEPVDIAAPLLIRSRALTEIDLIALIGRHGPAHARAIARRPGLNPTIAELISVIDRKSRQSEASDSQADRQSTTLASAGIGADAQPAGQPGEKAESARRRLRAMMTAAKVPEAARGSFPGASRSARIRDTALTGHAAFFHTALADSLGVDYAAICRAALSPSPAWLISALRALEVNEERAFLIAAAVMPSAFSGPESIRLFLARYRLLGHEAALDRVRAWQAESRTADETADARADRQLPDTYGKPLIRAEATG